MFRCQSCNQVVAAHTPETHVVVQTRQKKYTVYDVRDENKTSPKETAGTEIVKEIVIGPCCAGKYGREVFVPTMTMAQVVAAENKTEKPIFYRKDNYRQNTQRKQVVVERVSDLRKN